MNVATELDGYSIQIIAAHDEDYGDHRLALIDFAEACPTCGHLLEPIAEFADDPIC